MVKRIRLSRARGWRKPSGAVVVARPSRRGNPFAMTKSSAAERRRVVDQYRAWVIAQPDLLAQIRQHLRGRDVACWCPLDQPCHGDVLMELANAGGAEDDGGDGR